MKKLSVILTELWAVASLFGCLAEPSSVQLSWILWETICIASLIASVKVLSKLDRLGWLNEVEG